MSRQIRMMLGTLPCVAVLATGAFAQTAGTTTGAAGATNAATTTTTTTPNPAPAPVPTGTAATTTTTQTTTMQPDLGMANIPAPAVATKLPPTGGDPAEFVLLGSALSISMLALRRRFGR